MWSNVFDRAGLAPGDELVLGHGAGRIDDHLDDLRLTASSLQQVIDGCQIAGPGAELIQHYPKMLAELATRWESEAERVEWPDDLPREEVFTPAEVAAIDATEALLGKLRGDGSTGARR